MISKKNLSLNFFYQTQHENKLLLIIILYFCPNFKNHEKKLNMVLFFIISVFQNLGFKTNIYDKLLFGFC